MDTLNLATALIRETIYCLVECCKTLVFVGLYSTIFCSFDLAGSDTSTIVLQIDPVERKTQEVEKFGISKFWTNCDDQRNNLLFNRVAKHRYSLVFIPALFCVALMGLTVTAQPLYCSYPKK